MHMTTYQSAYQEEHFIKELQQRIFDTRQKIVFQHNSESMQLTMEKPHSTLVHMLVTWI